MRRFFKYVFASMLGFVLAGGVLLVLFFSALFSLVANFEDQFGSKETELVLNEKSVYHLKLNRTIEERSGNNPLDNMDLGPFSNDSKMSLRQIVQSINYAAQDDKISGIYLNINGFSGGLGFGRHNREFRADERVHKG